MVCLIIALLYRLILESLKLEIEIQNFDSYDFEVVSAKANLSLLVALSVKAKIRHGGPKRN